ncbi:MAG: transposase [Planctomycetaceae bacterium]
MFALQQAVELHRTPDITHWPTAKHFASWLCQCPGNHKTGGRQNSGKTRRSANRAAAALRIAPQSLERSQTALGVFDRRMKARLGPPQAITITATAHKLARWSIICFATETNPWTSDKTLTNGSTRTASSTCTAAPPSWDISSSLPKRGSERRHCFTSRLLEVGG